MRTTHLQAHADEIGERELSSSDPAIHKDSTRKLLLFFLSPSSGNRHLKVHNFFLRGNPFAFLVLRAELCLVAILPEYYVTTSSFREVIDVLVGSSTGLPFFFVSITLVLYFFCEGVSFSLRFT